MLIKVQDDLFFYKNFFRETFRSNFFAIFQYLKKYYEDWSGFVGFFEVLQSGGKKFLAYILVTCGWKWRRCVLRQNETSCKVWTPKLGLGKKKATFNVLLLFETKYSRMDQVKFVEDSLSKIWSDMVCLSR